MKRIPDASRDSLMAFIQEAIEPRSTVHTDGGKATPQSKKRDTSTRSPL